VHVEAEGDIDPVVHRVHVAVERRSDPSRREGHSPPVIATAEGGSLTQLLRRLVALANDNVEVARGLLRRSGGRARF
jgi:hypothetical protein